jgi:hypothetical protein
VGRDLTLFNDGDLPTLEDEDRTDGLEDLLPIARAVFSVWSGGAEVDWAGHAWEALARAGLTACRTELERTLVVCRLLALNVLYREFCTRAFEEGFPGEWSFDEEDVIGEYPRLNPFFLGQLAERQGVDIDIEIGYEFGDGSPVSYALRELVRAEYPAVARVLQDCWGTSGTFASLWVSVGAETQYPLTTDAISEAVNSDVTAAKLHAWQ